MAGTPDWAEQAALEFIAQYRGSVEGAARYLNDPVGFATDCIRWPRNRRLMAYQRDILAHIATHHRVAVRGPRGLGKTAISALIILWFALTRDACGIDWKIGTTAGSFLQVSQFTWPEVHKWARLLNWDALGRRPLNERSELLTLKIRLRFGEAFAASVENPYLIEGAHADHVLFVFDESKAIASAVFDSVEGTFSNAGTGDREAFAVSISTPGEPVGFFYDIHARKPGTHHWWARHVTRDEAIAEGAITADWCEQRRQQWGEDSALYHNHVLGEFYSSDEDGVVPLGWIEHAHQRHLAWVAAGRIPPPGIRRVGVDVARTGSDQTVMALRAAHIITEIRRSHREDTMQTTGRIKGIVDAEPETIPVVDVIGIGAGVVDRLREQGIPTEAFNASESTKRKDRSGELGYFNCLTENARVSPVGRPLRIFRSRYEGPLFEVETARGDHFTATAHHQVLTPQGWLSVESLHVGDKLCDAARSESPDRASVWPEVDGVPATIGEIYRAADILFGSERVQGAAVNFHGDVPVGEVDVVTINGDLLTVDPARRKCLQDLSLLRLLVAQVSLPSGSTLAQPFRMGDGNVRVSAALPDHRVPAGSGAAFVKAQIVDHQIVRLAETAHGDVVVAENTADDVLAVAVTPRQLVDRFSRAVPLDDLRLVEVDGPHEQLDLRIGPKRDIGFTQDTAQDVAVDAEFRSQCPQRRTLTVSGDNAGRIDHSEACRPDRLHTTAWLDSMFAEDVVDGGPVRPEALRERCERLAGNVPLDEVVRIERTATRQSSPYVYTLETSTGAYKSLSVVHRNCRSAAWWNMRELLDPAYGSEIALPEDDLLTGDLTAVHYRVMSGGKIKVEGKDEIRKRLGRSTDTGDAVIQPFWSVESSFATAYSVENCAHCHRPYMTDRHPVRCPHCRRPRERR